MYYPRRPTPSELAELTQRFLQDYIVYCNAECAYPEDDGYYWNEATATEHLNTTLIAVFDHYDCTLTTYSGKVMIVLWKWPAWELAIYLWDEGEILPLEEYQCKKDRK